jgi:hypothetical protein
LADGSKHYADLIIGADGIHVGTLDVSISHISLMFLVNDKTACIERRQSSENWVECFPIHHPNRETDGNSGRHRYLLKKKWMVVCLYL